MVVEVLGWWVWYLKQYIMEVAMFSGRTDYSASCSIVYLRLLSKKNFIIISYHFKTFKLLFACRVIPKALMPYEVNFSFIAILSSLFGASPIIFFLSHFLLFFQNLMQGLRVWAYFERWNCYVHIIKALQLVFWSRTMKEELTKIWFSCT